MESGGINNPAADPALWHLNSAITFLNHGSFGACPRAILTHQQRLREELESEPVDFLVRGLEERLDAARAALAGFVGAHSENVVFVPNATTGINTVLRSLRFAAGDEFLATDHEYNASRNALEYAAGLWNARVVTASVPFPVSSEAEVEEAILSQVTPRTKLALIDHVTSQTGLVFPIQSLTQQLENRGVRVLVDGAHAPGMVPLKLEELGASYYTGNCHKWICAPKGAAFLYVRPDRQPEIRPLVISHGANSARTDRSRFLLEFGWMGTFDPTAALSIPRAIDWMSHLMPGGWPALMQRNHELALAAREILCQRLGIDSPAPKTMIGSLASVPIAPSQTDEVPKSPLYLDKLQEKLFSEHQIEVPVIPWPAPPRRLLRVSAQAYNFLEQYRLLARALDAVGDGDCRLRLSPDANG